MQVRIQRELKRTLAHFGFRIKWTEPETFHISLLVVSRQLLSTASRVDQSGQSGTKLFPSIGKNEVEPISFEVSELRLMESELLPEGAHHTVLGTTCLGR